MTVDRKELRKLCAATNENDLLSAMTRFYAVMPDLLDSLDVADSRIATLEKQGSRFVAIMIACETPESIIQTVDHLEVARVRIAELRTGLREALDMWSDEVGARGPGVDDNYDRLRKLAGEP